MIFDIPKVHIFFDNRLVISWNIVQPKELPSLKKIHFEISGNPELIFNPKQSSIIDIPALEDNKIILNWIITKPKVKTEIFLSLSSTSIEERQTIVFNP